MAETPTYDPEVEYDLRVAFPAYVESWKYLPRDQIVAKGELINRLIEENGAHVVRSAVPRG